MTTRTWKNKPVADLVRCEPYPENLPKIKEIDSITNLPTWRVEDGGRALYNDMVVRLKIYTNASERRSIEFIPLRYDDHNIPWVLGHYMADRGRHFDRYWLWRGLHGYMITERLYKELLPEALAFKASIGFASVPGAKAEAATPDLCEMAMEAPMMSAFLLGGLCLIENGVVEISTETYNGDTDTVGWSKYGRTKAPTTNKNARDPYEPLDPRDHGLMAPISPAFFSSALLVQAGKSLFIPAAPKADSTGIPDTTGLVKRAKVTKPAAADMDFSEEDA